jgi:hypothetical protein
MTPLLMLNSSRLRFLKEVFILNYGSIKKLINVNESTRS